MEHERVGLREFNEHTSKYVHRVGQTGRPIDITYHGRPVARLAPPEEPESILSPEEWLSNLQAFSQELAGKWPPGMSAVDIIREERAEP